MIPLLFDDIPRARYRAKFLLALLLALLPLLLRAQATDAIAASQRTPVIIDTDIGDDTDDSWALVYALKNPGLDLKLVTTSCGKPEYRATLIAKFLTVAGRTDIPIGLGAGPDDGKRSMQSWLADFSLATYSGTVAKDGVQALIDAIKASPTPVTVIAIGPGYTLGAALQRAPEIAARANLVAMAGSIRVGYGNKPGQIPEYNVWRDIPDAQRVFSAPWRSIAITPLDTGDSVSVVGARYADLLAKGDALVHALLQNHALAIGVPDPAKINFGGSGYDEVAVLLAESNPARFANLEQLKITVDNQGRTMTDPGGTNMSVATSWKDLDGFLDHLDQVLLDPVSPAPAASAH